MKKILYILIMAIAVFVYYKHKPVAQGSFRIGVTAGPHAEIMEKVKDIAAKENFPITIVEFNDFILPNQALDQGELDANSYQHQAFLDEQVKSRNLKLISIAKTVVMPLGAYSKTLKTSDELAEGAVVAIPNDPTNEGRALHLLAQHHLIELKEGLTNPSVRDITNNPKRLKIMSVESPQLPRTLDDAMLCIINTDWVLLGGIDPQTALFKEDSHLPYTNIIVVRASDKDRAEVQKFLKIYRSEGVKDFIKEKFKGAVIPAW